MSRRCRDLRQRLIVPLLVALTIGGCAIGGHLPPSDTAGSAGPSPGEQRGTRPADPTGIAGESAAEPDFGAGAASTIDDADRRADDDEDSMLGAVGNFVDRSHAGASERFGGFMYQLDDFFAGDLQIEAPNTSYIRIRFDASKPALDNFELDPSIKLRVVLPRSEQRFRLLLSTEDDAGEGTSDEVSRVNALDRDDESVSLALRFVRQARTSGRLDFDVGARQRNGSLQLFGRINAGYRDQLDERWSMRADNKYYYYSKSGFDNRLRIDLTRALGEANGRFFRASSSADWRKGRRGATLGQAIGVYADLSERSALAIEALGVYDTALNGEQRDRYRGHELRLRYRRNIWRPWLFYEFWPAIAWPAEREYRRVWNGLLRLEITIGGSPLGLPVAGDGTGGDGPKDAVRADTAKGT